MLRLSHRCLANLTSRALCAGRRALSTAAGQGHAPGSKTGDPLRILFCGSDAFSCASLRALHREHVQNRRLVEALDVMVLPPKRTGRGLKQLRQVPCKAVAEELGLRIHQRETFRNWELPAGTNLVVVVSFGLFVPPRILGSTKYGGLNVHPSLLPDLRGPAPLHHAMLRGDQHFGITLQTLDDKNFDHGMVLAQTPAPGIPLQPDATLQQVLDEAAEAGARMLVQGLRDGVHIPPRLDVGWKAAELEARPLTHAPKVAKADAQIDWTGWTSGDDFARRIRVLSSVWTHAIDDKGAQRRLIWLDAAPAPGDDDVASAAPGCRGSLVFAQLDGQGARREAARNAVLDEATGACAVCLGEGRWVRVTRVKVEGQEDKPAARALRPFLRRT
ncbi:hypothetical protein HIM_01064 [Hirsutella minnesotensis 3608]|nr:hypothetical protein HIM_01064 [Hirsutella minnesotensis 3608]